MIRKTVSSFVFNTTLFQTRIVIEFIFVVLCICHRPYRKYENPAENTIIVVIRG